MGFNLRAKVRSGLKIGIFVDLERIPGTSEMQMQLGGCSLESRQVADLQLHIFFSICLFSSYALVVYVAKNSHPRGMICTIERGLFFFARYDLHL
jgi:hypothetical protein